jgi:hypothetical protein
MLIAIDWSTSKQLTTFDGKVTRKEPLNTFINRILDIKPIKIVLEESCPLVILHQLLIHKMPTYFIDIYTTQRYRDECKIRKTDSNDAQIIWHESQKDNHLRKVKLTNTDIQLYGMYNRYCRLQKARVALDNMRTSHLKHFGIVELEAYDKAITILHDKEKDMIKKITHADILNKPKIKGLGKRIWVGILITAHPRQFPCLSAYLRFCGLTKDSKEAHKYNRHIRSLYFMLSEEIMRKRDIEFRPIYDKCKADLKERFPLHNKAHIHRAALNRTATFLAKAIYNHCKLNTKKNPAGQAGLS